MNDSVVSNDGDVVIVKWFDNRTVNLASNFVGKGEEDKVKRWDKGQSTYIEIARPEIVKNYNHSMGGVDLLDQLISLYRIFIRSKKWTLRMIAHCIDFALVNSWLEYRKDCEILGVSKKKVLDLLHFRMRVADGLINVGKIVNIPRRGRPSSSPKLQAPPKRSRLGTEKRPAEDVQYDNTDHMPQFDIKKEATRCKLQECKSRSHIYCDKCNVHLCLTSKKNCFATFHRKSVNRQCYI